MCELLCDQVFVLFTENRICSRYCYIILTKKCQILEYQVWNYGFFLNFKLATDLKLLDSVSYGYYSSFVTKCSTGNVIFIIYYFVIPAERKISCRTDDTNALITSISKPCPKDAIHLKEKYIQAKVT